MKKFLITGSNGLVGQHMVEILRHQNSEIIATSLGPDKIKDNSGYIFELVDITNKLEVDYFTDRYRPDVIIHTAAMSQADECEEKRSECWKVNVEGTDNIVQAAKRTDAWLVHLSTDFVFNGTRGRYSEQDETSPVMFYGTSKLESEKRVISGCKKHTIVRTSMVYGLNEKMNRPNILTWVMNALGEGREIRVVDDQFRTPTFAPDLANALFMLAEKEKKGTFHVSGDVFLSVYDFAIKIAKAFNLDENLIQPVTTSMLSEKARRPLKTGLNLSKIRKEINYTPSTLEETFKYIEKQLLSFKI